MLKPEGKGDTKSKLIREIGSFYHKSLIQLENMRIYIDNKQIKSENTTRARLHSNQLPPSLTMTLTSPF